MGKKSRNRQNDPAGAQRVPAAAVEQSAKTATPWSTGRLAGVAAALFLVTVLVYSGVTSHEFVSYDDNEYVTQNEHVITGLTGENFKWAFTAFHSANWHPLTWISHMVDVQLFGMNAGAHAMVNVVGHALNSVLLLLILYRATRRGWPAAAVAALFALHPTHVESVAWVAERKDVLSTFLFLCTIGLYLFWREAPSMGRYIAVVIGFALALMAKPMVITLPFVLLLVDAWPLRRWNFSDLRTPVRIAPLVVEKLPLFALIIPSAILTMKAQTEAMAGFPLTLRIANAAQSYVAYIGKLLLPIDLAVIYPFREKLSAAFVLALIALAAATVGAFAVSRRRPYIAMGWLWYLGTLVPVIGILQVGRQAMADRYTYIPSIGIFIVVVWWLSDTPRIRTFLPAVAGIVLLVFAGATWKQVGYWRDSETLFRHALDVTHTNPPAHIQMGRVYLERQNFLAALQHFETAVDLWPGDAEAREGLGLTKAGMGDLGGALDDFRRVIAIEPTKAHHYQVAGRLAIALGRNDEAAGLLERSIALKDEPEARGLLATARGDLNTAVTNYAKAVEAQPRSADLRTDYGALLARTGRLPEAVAQYKEALQINAAQYDALMNLGSVQNKLGNVTEAVTNYEAAAKVRPRSPEPHIYVALAYANQRQWPAAIRAVEAAIALDPAQSNMIFTNAARLPMNDQNLQQYLATLRSSVASPTA